jgi:hypothetical protein
MAHNVFNRVNLAVPDGVLESPLFGKSTALAGGSSTLRRRTGASICRRALVSEKEWWTSGNNL